MKMTLAIVASILMASPAFASKARVAALGNADHLTDVQTAFAAPTFLLAFGEWATFEFGATNPAAGTLWTTATPNAEGGFAKAMGDAKLGFYLGHHDAKVNEARGYIFTNANKLTEENPIDLFYAAKAGGLAWGVRLGYASGKKDTGLAATKYKNDNMNLAASVAMDAWSAEVGMNLTDKLAYEGGNNTDYKGKGQMHVRGTYAMDTMFYSLAMDTNGGTDEGSTTTNNKTEFKRETITLNAIDSKKIDGGSFFYGLGLSQNTVTDKNKTTAGNEIKTTTMSLPMVIGVEADATSWMVLRGSVTQNVLISSKKVSTTPAPTPSTDGTDTVGNNTTVAAGAGLKFNKLTFDGTLVGSTTGTVNANTLFAMGSLTYNF